MGEKVHVLLDWVATIDTQPQHFQLYIERNEDKPPIVKDLWLTDEQYARLDEPESLNITIEGVL